MAIKLKYSVTSACHWILTGTNQLSVIKEDTNGIFKLTGNVSEVFLAIAESRNPRVVLADDLQSKIIRDLESIGLVQKDPE